MRNGASEQVAVFLKNERRVELGGSGNDELRSRPYSVQQRRARSDTGERWSPAAVCTKHIIRSDATTAEAAVDCLHLHRLDACYRRGHSITDASGQQLLEMNRELVSELARGPETILGLVLDRAHQDHLHFTRDRGRDLSRSRILREIKDQERIVLRIRA